MLKTSSFLLLFQAAMAPNVTEIPGDRLCSLVLSNPDGHFLQPDRELLHWMVYVGNMNS